MKEYEIIFTYLNGCSGSAHPQRTFDEAEIADTDAYVRSKHGKEFDKFEKQNVKLLQGQCLHARIIGFTHPITKEKLYFDSGLPDYFEEILDKLGKMS